MYIIGHRGARREAPENTLDGFLYALDNGIKDFELDLRLTKDNQLVVFHDKSLTRTTGQAGLIHDTDYRDLSQLDTRIGSVNWHRPTPIPLLRTVLEKLDKTISIQFEVKSLSPTLIPTLGIQLIELINEFDRLDRSVVTSLDSGVLRWFKHSNPQLSRGYVAERTIPNPLATALSLDCDLLIPNFNICTPALVHKAHVKGLEVSTWTPNRKQDWLYLASIGVDSIITDYPTVALNYFCG